MPFGETRVKLPEFMREKLFHFPHLFITLCENPIHFSGGAECLRKNLLIGWSLLNPYDFRFFAEKWENEWRQKGNWMIG
jgi:hypothetical protein